jgi:hypothetical protein
MLRLTYHKNRKFVKVGDAVYDTEDQPVTVREIVRPDAVQWPEGRVALECVKTGVIALYDVSIIRAHWKEEA